MGNADLVARRRAEFAQFYKEMMPVLVDFVGKLGINPSFEVLNHAEAFLPYVANALDEMEIRSDQDKIWLITRLGYFVGEFFVQKYRGCWRVEDDTKSPYFARYVVGEFDLVRSGSIDPFEISRTYVNMSLPRQLEAVLVESDPSHL